MGLMIRLTHNMLFVEDYQFMDIAELVICVGAVVLLISALVVPEIIAEYRRYKKEKDEINGREKAD